jgi:hypothetical protein
MMMPNEGPAASLAAVQVSARPADGLFISTQRFESTVKMLSQLISGGV